MTETHTARFYNIDAIEAGMHSTGSFRQQAFGFESTGTDPSVRMCALSDTCQNLSQLYFQGGRPILKCGFLVYPFQNSEVLVSTFWVC